jgi:hypothetical protein
MPFLSIQTICGTTKRSMMEMPRQASSVCHPILPNHPLDGGVVVRINVGHRYLIHRPDAQVSIWLALGARPSKFRAQLSPPANSVLAVAWVGCMLPCRYLPNWRRKRFTSQSVAWRTLHLQEEVSSVLVRHVGPERSQERLVVKDILDELPELDGKDGGCADT